VVWWLRGYSARVATVKDADSIYEFLEKFIATRGHSSLMAVRRATLKANIDYYIVEKDALVVHKEDGLVGVYIGNGNSILHLVNTGGYYSLVLLFYVAFVIMQDIDKDSIFKVQDFSQIATLNKQSLMLVGHFSDVSLGIIPSATKKWAESRFNKAGGYSVAEEQ
jgi:hypothetical protein